MNKHGGDWGSHLIVTCRCRHVFRSRTKQVMRKHRLRQISELPCPNCGRDDDMIDTHTDWSEFDAA